MIKYLISSMMLLLWAAPTFALPTLTLGEATMQGSTIMMKLSLSGGTQDYPIAALKTDIKFDSSLFALVMDGKNVSTAVGGAAITSKSKTLAQTNTEEGLLNLTVYALPDTTSTITDGEIAQLSFKLLPGSLVDNSVFQVVNSSATDAQSKPVPLNVNGSTYVVTNTGDISGNSITELADALLVLQAVVGYQRLTPEQYKKSDMNGDGKVNVADAVLILAKVVGL